MNIGYIFDLDNIVKEEDLTIPHLSGLYYKHYSREDFTCSSVINFRDKVMRENNIVRDIDKHIFYIVIKNNRDTIEKVSLCIDEVQKDVLHFNQVGYEFHVLLNLIEEDGVSIKEYENIMHCLKNNAVCVYSWVLDKYDYKAGMPIIEARRSHAIARLADIIKNHRNKLSLLQMNQEQCPIYTLFGDSSVFFNEEDRDQAVRYYYYYKNIQHLLNLPDQAIDDYLGENIIPYQKDKKELEKRLDSSSSVFLLNNRIPIEASIITEKTQGLLLKSSDNDNDYLVNATDNRLVFIEDLSRKQKWQMSDTDTFVNEYWQRLSTGKDFQDTITDEFIRQVQERVVIHKRTVFDVVNNEVSRSRKKHINDFKGKIDKYLLEYLNKKDSHNYSVISETLTPSVVKNYHSNIDCGIAFLNYLNSGNADYLGDLEMSAGDINLLKIRESVRDEENRLRKELDDKETEISEYYSEGEDGQPSNAKSSFSTIDKEIKAHTEEIRLLNFQLENWIDGDASQKLTARSRATISFASGILISGLWAYVYFNWISPYFSFDKYAIWTSIIILLIGFIVGFFILWNVVNKRKAAEEKLKRAKDKKKLLMRKCMDEMNALIEIRYRHMLAFHGLKTINELMEYVRKKIEDLLSFRKTLFRCLVNYRLSSLVQAEKFQPDSNTIELSDIDVNRLLFGDNDDIKVPFCLSNEDGATLAETFEDYKKKKVRFETTRFAPDYNAQDEFDQTTIDKEVISCREEDHSEKIQYTALERASILPQKGEVAIDDINQGQCGDCYFLATLASIAQINPEYIIGERGMIETIGEGNRYFRVKFYDKEGNRVNVDIDNRFWNKYDRPIYAGIGQSKATELSSYNPWVMAVEKAWAKANNGSYDHIEGASADGQERVRMVEYSYAVTGKSAFYCITKNIPNRDRLQEMIMKHVLQDKLPITLYSASPSDMAFPNKDPYLVTNHAYSLKAVHEDGTFDIFNPWNNHMSDEDVRGKHYDKVNIDFIKDNFDVVVFFGIKEADFSSFERELTGNASEFELASKIEELMNEGLNQLNCKVQKIESLLSEEVLENLYFNSSFLCNATRLKDKRGYDGNDMNITFIEPARGCDGANAKLRSFLDEDKGERNIIVLNARNDDKQSLTILRISPHYILKNFHDTK
ncbi:MAG: hypothetical protein IJ342_09980 [Muribaculaceae bacterium]|nr:hypothetical protein [Muribaculaceae bacterium]